MAEKKSGSVLLDEAQVKDLAESSGASSPSSSLGSKAGATRSNANSSAGKRRLSSNGSRTDPKAEGSASVGTASPADLNAASPTDVSSTASPTNTADSSVANPGDLEKGDETVSKPKMTKTVFWMPSLVAIVVLIVLILLAFLLGGSKSEPKTAIQNITYEESRRF